MRLGSDVAMAVVQAGSVALIRPVAWESPYPTGVVLKRQKKKKVTTGPIVKITVTLTKAVFMEDWDAKA